MSPVQFRLECYKHIGRTLHSKQLIAVVNYSRCLNLTRQIYPAIAGYKVKYKFLVY